jgi:membrane-bound lytic murein transglycosylase F
MNRTVRILRVLYHRKRYILIAVAVVVVLAVLTPVAVESSVSEPQPTPRSWSEIQQSNTLRAVMIPSSISAFRYSGKWRGREFEDGSRVASLLGLRLVVLFAPSEQAMFDSLFCGAADIAMWPVSGSVASRYLWLRPCGYRYQAAQAMISPRSLRISARDTSRYTLAILAGSRQEEVALGDSLHLNFSLLPWCRTMVSADSATVEDLVAGVAEGRWDATMVDRSFGELMVTYYTKLRLSESFIGSEDTVSWMVVNTQDTLAAMIDSLCAGSRHKPSYAPINKRYYELSHGHDVSIKYLLGGGQLSVYDDLFRKYSSRIPWDWRLLAAVAYVESRFDPFVESHKGARGLMQLMPSTAERFGCPEELTGDPETSVIAGANLLSYLQQTLRNKITRSLGCEGGYAEAPDTLRERVNEDIIEFTIAGYNSGVGHIIDAINLADSLGYDVARWEGSVATCLEMKTDSVYYNHPAVKLGKFNGPVTTDYVRNVLNYYEDFCDMVQ